MNQALATVSSALTIINAKSSALFSQINLPSLDKKVKESSGDLTPVSATGKPRKRTSKRRSFTEEEIQAQQNKAQEKLQKLSEIEKTIDDRLKQPLKDSTSDALPVDTLVQSIPKENLNDLANALKPLFTILDQFLLIRAGIDLDKKGIDKTREIIETLCELFKPIFEKYENIRKCFLNYFSTTITRWQRSNKMSTANALRKRELPPEMYSLLTETATPRTPSVLSLLAFTEEEIKTIKDAL